jgi:hypothetical protein
LGGDSCPFLSLSLTVAPLCMWLFAD